MKTDLQTIKDTFQMGYETYEESYRRADEVSAMAKGKMYTAKQLQILKDRGQPAEYFNVITLFNRSLQGYFSSVVNTIQAKSVGTSHVDSANILNIGIEYTLRMNDWDYKRDRLQLSCYNSGTMTVGYSIKKIGVDKLGRDINQIEIENVPYFECIRDQKSRKPDYSDGRFFHRFRWISEDEVLQLFPNANLSDLNPFSNETGVSAADYKYAFGSRFAGRYNVFNEYLVVHTNIVDNKGVTWEVWWCGDKELKRQKMPFDSLKFSYRQVLLDVEEEDGEFNGIYKDVVESQKAINQAILQIQQLANGSKVLVETNAVDDVEEFQIAWARVNSVIDVNRIAGIEHIEFSRDIAQQYVIIDKAFDRIQRVLHVNDAFLGNAFSQDSGKKVALQKNSAMMALRYIGMHLDIMYRFMGLDIIHLLRQYVNATMQMESEEQQQGQTKSVWSTVNTPLIGLDNMPVTKVIVKDGKPFKKIINDPATSFMFDRMNVKVESIPYDLDDSADKLMLENTLQGSAGQIIANAQPGEFLKIAALSIREHRTKNSNKIADAMDYMAKQMGALPWVDPREVNSAPPGGEQPHQTTGAGATASAMGLDNNIQNN